MGREVTEEEARLVDDKQHEGLENRARFKAAHSQRAGGFPPQVRLGRERGAP